jgi:glutaredoxin 3
VIEVFQAEWCPYSRMVRERLNELDLPFIARPVPADRGDRTKLEEVAGTRSIPVVRLDDGTLLTGDTREIVAELNRRYDEPAAHAAAHRRQLEAHGGL